MEQITIAKFLEGYEEGYITDIVSVKDKVYGKDPRGQANKPKPYKIVWVAIP